jgi:rod shape-determining protein MreC
MRHNKVLKVHLSDSLDDPLSVPPALYFLLFLMAIALFVMDTEDMRPVKVLKEAYQESLHNGLSKVQDKVQGWQRLVIDWKNLYEANQINQDLKATIVSLRKDIRTAEASLRDLQHLKEQVHFLPTPPNSFITTRIRRYNYGPSARRMLIETQNHPAIAPRHIVTAHYAMVGRILSVQSVGAEVLLITDKASRVPVIGEMSHKTALLQGTNGQSLEMRYTHEATFMHGELLLTTGDDSFLPAGIPVAKIVIQNGNTSAVPLYHPKDIDFVQVLY